MAEDTSVERDSFSKPCCAKAKERYLKLKQSRDFLRTALRRIEPKLTQLQNERIQLDKDFEAELRRAELEKEAKEKEMSVRAGLEKEISDLESKLVSLRKSNLSRDQNHNGEVAALHTCVSELEGETARLTKLLEKANKKEDFEKKKIKEENIKLEKACQNEKEAKLKESTSKSGFENEILNLKSEIAALKESKGRVDRDEDGEVVFLRTCVLDGKAEISRLIELLDNEKKNVEMEKKKVLAEKKIFEEAWKFEVEARSKDSSVREGLENDISKLKSQIDLLLTERDIRDKEAMLQTFVSEAEVESNRLKVLLDQEKKKATSEKEKAEKASKIEIETISKESPTRADLENEILVLKSEIGSLLAERSSKNQDDGGELKKHVSEVEAENNLLNELLDQVRKIEAEARSKESSLRASFESENFDLKSKITSLLTEMDSKNQEGSQIVLLQTRVLEAEAESYRLKELLGQESRKVISEKKKAKAEKKKAKAEKEKAKAWKSEAEARLKETLCFENEIFILKSGKKKAEEEVNELGAKLVSEKSKVEEAHKKIEFEKHVANREKKCAELEMEKAEQWKRSVEEERKKLMDERHNSSYLFSKHEEERQRSELLEKEIQELKLARKRENDPRITFNASKNADGELMLLEKELKLEKKHVRHAKRVVKFEKMCNNILGQELHHLKQEFSHLDYRLKALGGCFSSGGEGIDSPAEMNNSLNPQRSNGNTKFSGKETTSLYGTSEKETMKPCYTGLDCFDRFRSAAECSAQLFDGRGSAKKPISDISSLGSLIGEPVRNNLQDSAAYSTGTTFSGRLTFGSPENNIFSVSRPDNMKEYLKQCSIFPRLSAESTNPRTSGNLGIIAENSPRTPVHRDMDTPCLSLNKHGGINVVSRGTAPKRKRLLDEDQYLCSELHSFPTQIEEKQSAVTDSLIQENNMPTNCCSQLDGELKSSGDGRS